MPYGQDPLSALRRFVPAGSPLTPEAIVRGAQGTGVDPRALAVIARKESEFGRTSGRFRNNAYGWGVHLGPSVNTSSNWEEGTRKVARGLSGNLYKGSGITRLRDVIMKYAPPSENNTDQYIRQVEDWYRQMGGDPEASIFGQAQARLGQAAPDGGMTDPTANGATVPEVTGTLEDSIRGAFGDREKGESLFRTVMRGAMASMTSQPDVQGADGALSAVESVTLKLGGKAAPAEQQLIGAAKGQLGVDYSWGGGGPGGPSEGFAQGAGIVGFDCSSLMQYAYAKQGVQIPRTTYQQIKAGRAVNAGNRQAWRPGDLLFPSEGHVQMFIGNGNVIEAPRTGGVVQIVPARSKYIAVRRIL